MKFTHGQRVLCTIDGTEITDAKISINKDGTPFICQNEWDGNDAEDKLGYQFSWSLDGDFTDLQVKNLRPARSWDNLSQADVGAKIKDQLGDIGVILEVSQSGKLFVSSNIKSDLVGYFSWCHIETPKKNGWTFLDEEPTEEVVEMTVEKVSKLVGKKVKIVE